MLKESFEKPFGIKDPLKDFGGVLAGTDTSRKVVRREEGVTKDGKHFKAIELADMEGYHGYGSIGPLSGDRVLRSVSMWQIQTGTKDGKPVYETWKKPTTQQADFWGNPVFAKGKPVLEARDKEPMLADEFNKRFNELDPAILEPFSIGHIASAPGSK